jgi:hypothetical protein
MRLLHIVKFVIIKKVPYYSRIRDFSFLMSQMISSSYNVTFVLILEIFLLDIYYLSA